MNRYEMTERGKIVVAILLVTVLLVIPTIIILISVSTCSMGDIDNPMLQSSPDGDALSPGVTSTPLPTPGESDLDVTETPEVPDPDSEQSLAAGEGSDFVPFNGNDSSSGDTLAPGPVALNVREGTMSFLFFPDEQNRLDDDTVSTIGEFLSSPRNTSGTLIRVEIPQISEADEDIFKSALLQGFAQHNIQENRLLLVKTQTRVTERHFEVSLSFVTPSSTGTK